MPFIKKSEQAKREFMGVQYLVGATSDRMMVTLMRFKGGSTVAAHRHGNEQAGYCLSGRYQLRIGEEKHLVEPGDSYVIPSDCEHAFEILENAEAVEVFSPPRRTAA
jgi:quercetin dioxygenase-like cupin family protein